MQEKKNSLQLRKKAKEILEKRKKTEKSAFDHDIENLIEELSIHQIELELQNEELRKSQIELEQKSQEYFNLYDLAPVGYLKLDDSGKIISLNFETVQLLANNKQEVLGKNLHEFINPDDQDEFYHHLKQVSQSKQKSGTEIRIKIKPDQCIYVSIESIIVQENDKNFIFCTLKDIDQLKKAKKEIERFNNELEAKVHSRTKKLYQEITERKDIEKDLRISQERLHLSMWAGSIAWWDWDYKTNLVIASKGKYEMLGYEAPEKPVPLETWTNRIHPDDYEEVMQIMLDHLYGKIPSYDVIYRLKHNNGEWFYFWDRGKVIEWDSNKKPVRLVGTVQNINDKKQLEIELEKYKDNLEHLVSERTEELEQTNEVLVKEISQRKAAETKLKELNATKDKFFSIVAHDLKNPFNTILTLSEMLKTNIAEIDKKEIAEYISNIYKSSKAGFDLLNNLLNWARTQTGRIKVNPLVFDIRDTILMVKDLTENQAKEKNLTIANNITEPTLVYADPNMIATILRNLISNAIKYSPEHTTIQIKATEKNSKRFISISDEGVGISEENQKHLFQIDKGYSTKGTNNETGTGLGLIICQEFINMNKGSISIKSEEQKGSTFTFSLPIKK